MLPVQVLAAPPLQLPLVITATKARGHAETLGLKLLPLGNHVQAAVLDPREVSPCMETPGVGVLLPAWCSGTR